MRTTLRLGVASVALGGAALGLLSVAAGATAAAAPSSAAARAVHRPAVPIIFGHRGAAGYRPEHTYGGYELAAKLGADYLEPDLVPTKDGYLVDRHEPEISMTTDVAKHPEFAKLKTTKVVDGVRTTGWFTTDFTLKQLRTLRAVERIPDIRQHNTLYNGVWRIPTLQEDIDQTIALGKKYHRTIGIVPEIKHSTFFRSVGLPMEQRTLDVLRRNHLDGARPRIPTVLQSFEVHNLQVVHRLAPHLKLLQLTSATGAPADFVAAGDPRTYADITTPKGLAQIAKYATFLGPDKTQIVPLTSSNGLGTPTTLIRDAHRAGLLVAPYTFRNENAFLPTDFRRGTNPSDYGDAIGEDTLYYELGVDGFFTDNSDTAFLARKKWLRAGRPGYAGRLAA